MNAIKPLILLSTIAACAEIQQFDEDGNPILPPLPANVQAAMPEGMPRAFVFEGGNGCWAVGLEAGTPRQGRPLRDANGRWVCNEGVTPPDEVAVEPLVEPTV